MPVELTIIDLGQIGASISLAAGGEAPRVHRTGHDRLTENAHKAQ